MRIQAIEIIGFVSLVAVGGGCTESATGQGPQPPGQTNPPPPVQVEPTADTTRAYLAKPRTFHVMPTSMAQVTAKRVYLDQLEETAMLPLVGGDVTVAAQTDGTLALMSMSLDLGNVTLSAASVPPDGLNLTDVRLSLKSAAAAAADWTADGQSANASGTTDFLLDWSIEAEAGSIEPLATQRITGVPLELAVVEDHGRLSLSVHANRDGVFWQWSGLLELADLKLDLDAAN
jgi:hypothetical protein